MPIDPNDITPDRQTKGTPAQFRWGKYQSNLDTLHGLNPDNISKDLDISWKHLSPMIKTMRDIGKVYPAFETAANFATSSYGVPISGLVGIAALPFGAEAAANGIEAVQKFMVYQPQTEQGQSLTEAAAYPMQKLADLGRYAGEKADEVEGPVAGAISEGLINAAPSVLGMRGPKSIQAKPAKFSASVEEGINKGVRPSVIKKEVWGQRVKYMENAKIAVDDIIKNKDKLKLIDKDGNEVTGRFPESLSEFAQAIDQIKRQIFDEYDALSKQADQRGASVNMNLIVNELDAPINNNVLKTMSPETVEYAMRRKRALEGKSFTTQEIQQMVQLLNQTEKSYNANPTPAMYGKAYIDSLIANNLRSALDAAIEGATGVEYQPLKNRYGALRMLETDVTKRAIVDARKNAKGLIDFSDIFSGSQAVQGILSGQLPQVAAAATAKGIASFFKRENNPNKIIKRMFNVAEKYSRVDVGGKNAFVTPAGKIVSGVAAGIDDEED